MTLLISSDDGWMYIMLAADGGRIAQLCRHPFEHLDDIAFGILFRGGWADHVQQMGRCNGVAPSAKIFAVKSQLVTVRRYSLTSVEVRPQMSPCSSMY